MSDSQANGFHPQTDSSVGAPVHNPLSRPPDPPQMTEEQLGFFVELEAEAVARVEKRAESRDKRWRRGATGAFAVLFAATMLVYHNGQSVSAGERNDIVAAGRTVAISACNARYADREELREVLNQSKKAVRRQFRAGVATEQQRDDAIKFYNARLKGLPLPDCRKADDALERVAGNSDAKIKVPDARFPGDGKSAAG